MGEAKRRKKLDPNWGKGTRKSSLDKIADGLVERMIANREWHQTNMDSAAPDHLENLKCVLLGLTLIEGINSIQLPELNKSQNQIFNSICKTLAKFVLQDPNHSLSAERSPFLKENKEVTREVGVTLNSVGGCSLMVQAAKMIVPPCDRRELEVVWDGIGKWKM